MNKLTKEYDFVNTKTSSLNTASENLIQEQTKLNLLSEDIRFRLKHFNQADHLSQRLQNPTFSPASEQFAEIICNIDECLDYIKNHVSLVIPALNLFYEIYFLGKLQRSCNVQRQVQAMSAQSCADD